jgi:hypothetical protein
MEEARYFHKLTIAAILTSAGLYLILAYHFIVHLEMGVFD